MFSNLNSVIIYMMTIEAYMIVNFRTREISRAVFKLTRTFMLNYKKILFFPDNYTHGATTMKVLMNWVLLFNYNLNFQSTRFGVY